MKMRGGTRNLGLGMCTAVILRGGLASSLCANITAGSICGASPALPLGTMLHYTDRRPPNARLRFTFTPHMHSNALLHIVHSITSCPSTSRGSNALPVATSRPVGDKQASASPTIRHPPAPSSHMNSVEAYGFAGWIGTFVVSGTSAFLPPRPDAPSFLLSSPSPPRSPSPHYQLSSSSGRTSPRPGCTPGASPTTPTKSGPCRCLPFCACCI